MRFLNTLTGQLIVVLLIFGLIAFTLFQRFLASEEAAPKPPPAISTGDVSPIVTNEETGEPVASPTLNQPATRAHQIGESVSRFLVPDDQTPEPARPVIPRSVREQMLAPPVPLTLFVNPDPPPAPAPPVSSQYAPYGRLIRCKLVTALESSNLATPLIAITLEPVWNRDQAGVAHEIIPAGIEVHGPAVQRGRTRDRLEAAGQWVFVWRTDDEKNGLELPVSGIALTRDADARTGLIGPADASAGIKGQLIESAANEEIRLFAAAFLEAAASSGYSSTPILNPLTSQVVEQRDNTLRNAGVSGVQAVLSEWADRIRGQIEEDGFFVAVPAGREIYLYVNQTIDLSNARRGSFSQPLASTQP